MPDTPTFHPFADIFPMLDETALAELAADIKAESQREPIFLWRDQIIDGRNRYKACKLAGIEPIFKRVEFPGGEAEALAYVLSRNLQRRHLTIAQRALIAAKVATLKRGQTQIGDFTDLKTQDQAANMLKVSTSSVGYAKAVLDRGGPELVAAVESGEIGLHKAAGTVRHSEPQPPRRAEPQSGAAMLQMRQLAVGLGDAELMGLISEWIESRSGVARGLSARADVMARFGAFEAARGSITVWLKNRLDSERANLVRDAFASILEKTTKARLIADLSGVNAVPLNLNDAEVRRIVHGKRDEKLDAMAWIWSSLETPDRRSLLAQWGRHGEGDGSDPPPHPPANENPAATMTPQGHSRTDDEANDLTEEPRP